MVPKKSPCLLVYALANLQGIETAANAGESPELRSPYGPGLFVLEILYEVGQR